MKAMQQAFLPSLLEISQPLHFLGCSSLNVLGILTKHLLRGSLHLRMNVELSKVGVQLLKGLPLGLRVASIDQDSCKDVERHEDEVHPRADVGNCDGPDLSHDDGTERASGLCHAETFASDRSREDFRCVNPGNGTETHTICMQSSESLL